MNYVQKLTAASIIIIGLSTGCKKEKAAPVADNTITILQSGDWKITAFNITPALNGVTDVMLNMPPCAKDNLLQFKANGVFYFDEGATKCNPTGEQRETGSWSYDASIKQLRFASASLDFIINIQLISNISISGTREVVANGASYTYSGTLTKQ